MDEYLTQMLALTQDRDYERAHGEADDLLVKALLSLRANATPEQAEQITKLTDAYAQVGKWYA
ncbi:hypothetical protein Q0M94_28330 (plasmid) [Deinococcus radiomollis]|uniref:hypothetical protein n=1 Tax=Deinococcus radiomollis TaxID=468916 RepID=UPI0038915D84